jgi:4-aminobutyrate aminotransferase/(S)-3-amino-2-methylpropionate transaminase
MSSVVTPGELRSLSGSDAPQMVVRPPGPQSRSWLERFSQVMAPMGPGPDHSGSEPDAGHPAGRIVYARARGSNVLDVDGNRYVDLATGFGAVLLGHAHAAITEAIARQSHRLLQALGDVHPSDVKVELAERLARLLPAPNARAILGQSGADAVSAALKTAVLCTGRPGIIAFRGAYHGLSYGPLPACGLRPSYRAPFARQLNPSVTFAEYPSNDRSVDQALGEVRSALGGGDVGAVLVEPVLGRGGVVVPPARFLPELRSETRDAGALLVADEIWTGLGRAGRWLCSVESELLPDLICLGKGLGGGLPISACLGTSEVMQRWQRQPEVVHTSTFAGAPLGCATALATLEVISRDRLVERAESAGRRWLGRLRESLAGRAAVEVRGVGLMIGIDLTGRPGGAAPIARALLERGYLVSTGGGGREAIVLTPALNIEESLLDAFNEALCEVLES